MRRHRLPVPFYAASLFACAALGYAACDTAPISYIGLSMTAPAGVLDEATSLTLYVFPSSEASCNDDGTLSALPEGAASHQLQNAGCEGGAKWCGEIKLDQDDSEQMFYVEATSAAGLLAQGCTTAVIDKDPVEVSIKVQRHVEPACCGDGELQVGELCDLGGDDTCGGSTADTICTAECTTNVVWVDDQDGTPAAKGQGHLTMAFAPGEGQLSGGLRAAWNFSSTPVHVGLRTFQADLSAVTEPAVLEKAHRVYFRCSGTDQLPLREQSAPSIAAQGSGAVLAYLSNEKQSLRVDAVVLTLNSDGCSDQLTAPIVSNEQASVDDVDVAVGPGGLALVVWQQNGRILGRTYDGTAVGAAEFVISDAGAAPRVAGSSAGWVVVYQGAGTGDSDGVFMRRVSTSLVPSDPILVNAVTDGAQDQPDVAAVNDGSVAVVFRSGDDIFFQRYSAADAPTADDQDDPLNLETNGAQAAPAVGASPSGDFFAVAWESAGAIRARFIGKSDGFLFNNVSGQNDDFEVTDGTVGDPHAPAVAVGGYVAVGWQDLNSKTTPGLVMRRLPLPR
ncbi:MAG: hypothetical protein U0271_18550 [Polyangiaceae bacterium]